MTCPVCSGRGWVGKYAHERDACPRCTFEAEREWEAYQGYERLKRISQPNASASARRRS